MQDERWGYPTPPPQAKPKRSRGWLGPLVLLAVPVLGVGTYVMLQRLSNDVLTVVATIACASGVSLPGLLVAVAVLLRRAENNGRENRATPQPTMTQPVMMMVPPMALPQQHQMYPQAQTLWEQQPTARRFTIVGDGGSE